MKFHRWLEQHNVIPLKKRWVTCGKCPLLVPIYLEKMGRGKLAAIVNCNQHKRKLQGYY